MIPVNNEPSVLQLLKEAGLPIDDLNDGNTTELFGQFDGELLEGVIGIERYGRVALLRSLTVAKQNQGRNIGRKLISELETYALKTGVTRLYLLTTSAAEYFKLLGYRVEDRCLAPESITKTKQFSGICPSIATFMVKEIAQNH